MKKITALFMTTLLSLTLTACGSSTDSNPSSTAGGDVKSKTLRMAFNQTENHPQYQAMLQFSDSFKAATNGKYEIKLFPNETLGNQRETLEQCQSGTLDMAIVNNTHPGSVSDYFKTFDLPFLFSNVEEAIQFMNHSPIIDEVKGSMEQYGIKVAAYFPAGSRSMYTTKGPIQSVTDMKGLKIRTMESDVYIKMMSLFGGNATPMAMGELYTAIQSGVVDGAENNEITYVNSKHYEVAPYWSETKHLIVPDWLLINKELYESFTNEERAAFDEECAKASERVEKLWNEEVERLMATLTDKKVTITKDIDVDSFTELVQPLHDELTGSNANIKKVYDAIQEMK